MKITINRPDLITKEKVIKLLKCNKLGYGVECSNKHVDGWNNCIDEMCEVIKRKHI